MNVVHSMGIEEKVDLIESSATRYYFREVYSSYINGNYRAAVVSLWSVLVCDAVYKTQKLFELTGDVWAQKKLSAIEKLQQENSKSSEWELDLFEGFYTNKKFIGIGEISNIRDIQKKRHLCAHPVLSEDNALYTPNKESIKSMILNALDDFLIRKNYYGKDIFPVLRDTLKENSEYYSELKNINPLINKYCQRLTPSAIYQIFRNFYKFSFKLDDEDAVKYRIINQNACFQLYKEVKKSVLLIQKMKEEIDLFENISFKTQTLTYLFHFLSFNREIYDTFSKEMRDRLETCRDKETEDDVFYGLKICSMFSFKKPDEYFKFLKKALNDNQIKRFTIVEYEFITDVYHDTDCREALQNISISYAENSSNYDDADNRFNLVLSEKLLNSFTSEQLNRLLTCFDTNSQISERRRSRIDHEKLEKRLAEITA
ncbi:Uncharacterised protein [Yersinia pseudotuberculosis]|uniref:hypothetical protein n=1 Tax=Yersinia TaxID=629 RepID=UPI0005DA6740|nr:MULTISPECIES: hypothetical protein [Yersinia]MBS0056052.1 hypothetical protein [Yersinia sp. Marseille-Q3913]QKJ15020.1 hypothetical protein HRD70_07415 [Yersinia kristensenii]CNK68320.1 Uncharacterised protein [Yersinia pseudotuberculosis]